MRRAHITHTHTWSWLTYSPFRTSERTDDRIELDRSSYTTLLSMNNLMKRNEKAINIVSKSTTIAWRTFQVKFDARARVTYSYSYDCTAIDLLIWHRCTRLLSQIALECANTFSHLILLSTDSYIFKFTIDGLFPCTTRV